jgi:hypothetical protein
MKPKRVPPGSIKGYSKGSPMGTAMGVATCFLAKIITLWLKWGPLKKCFTTILKAF